MRSLSREAARLYMVQRRPEEFRCRVAEAGADWGKGRGSTFSPPARDSDTDRGIVASPGEEVNTDSPPLTTSVASRGLFSPRPDPSATGLRLEEVDLHRGGGRWPRDLGSVSWRKACSNCSASVAGSWMRITSGLFSRLLGSSSSFYVPGSITQFVPQWAR
jgi:hypothetical protein